MGQSKREIDEVEDKWASGNARCAICGQSVPFSERITYFERGICDYCRHQADRDD